MRKTDRFAACVADPLTAIELCYEKGWTDGLPVVPPEQSLVEAMLAMEGRPPETVLAKHPATGNALTPSPVRAMVLGAVRL